jgi:beta-lactamase regulating signal transducer with metallopeptidase domain
VLLAAVVLGASLLLLTTALPARLAHAGWPQRAPALGLLLWQAGGLVAGVVAIELALTVALTPAGATHRAALAELDLTRLPAWSLLAAVLGLALLLRLLLVLLASTARVLRARRRHRTLVDLVATRNPLLRHTSVVDHDLPVAYCLPGLRARVVLSRGAVSLLREDELHAVLAHERAHLAQRHDLVVLPFVALGATFPRLPCVRTARTAVAQLVEMLADDRAVRRHDRRALARALWKVGSAQVPSGGLGASGDDVLLRARRLLEPGERLPLRAQAAVLAGTAALLALPLLGVLLPVLAR